MRTLRQVWADFRFRRAIRKQQVAMPPPHIHIDLKGGRASGKSERSTLEILQRVQQADAKEPTRNE